VLTGEMVSADELHTAGNIHIYIVNITFYNCFEYDFNVATFIENNTKFLMFETGLVSKVVEDDELPGEALKLAETIASMSLPSSTFFAISSFECDECIELSLLFVVFLEKCAHVLFTQHNNIYTIIFLFMYIK
jgi:hypothetical protein